MISSQRNLTLSLVTLFCSLLLCHNNNRLLAVVRAESDFLNNKNLIQRVQKWMHDPDGTAQKYGPIAKWDLSNVTSLRNLFSFNEPFNEDIRQWNVSGVTDFSSVFWEATSFDRDLGAWDVRRAQTMACMFCGASSYTGKGLEQWKDQLGNVQDMYNMFEGTSLNAETVDLGEWHVASVTNFRQMFLGTPLYDQRLCWNVSVLARTENMFSQSGACFQSKCVVDHILDDAQCSAAGRSVLEAKVMLLLLGLTTGLVSLMSWL